MSIPFVNPCWLKLYWLDRLILGDARISVGMRLSIILISPWLAPELKRKESPPRKTSIFWLKITSLATAWSAEIEETSPATEPFCSIGTREPDIPRIIGRLALCPKEELLKPNWSFRVSPMFCADLLSMSLGTRLKPLKDLRSLAPSTVSEGRLMTELDWFWVKAIVQLKNKNIAKNRQKYHLI